MGAMHELDTVLKMGNWADPMWRLSNLYKGRDENMQEFDFVPNEEQLFLLNNLWYRNNILKCRQIGFTTVLLLAALDLAIWRRNFIAAFICDNKDNAVRIFDHKVLWVYDQLPDIIKEANPVKTRSKTELAFANGSTIYAGLGSRGGTHNWMHVSELGKVANKFPEKAREIITGGFPSVHKEGYLFIESTAEGQSGRYFDLTMESKKLHDEKRKLTRKDFRFHFVPWWRKKSYALTDAEVKLVPIDDNDKLYFDVELEAKRGIVLTPNQKAWWIKERDVLQEDMGREHPSYPEEAFEQAIRGAVYEKQMTLLRKSGMISSVPWDPNLPVNTFWDFGLADNTAIWFHQLAGGTHRFFRYYQNNGEGLAHYWDCCQALGVTWGKHYLPHDADMRIQGQVVQTKRQMLEQLGMKNVVTVPRIPSLKVGIDRVRANLPMAAIDAENCKKGLACLDAYCWEWDSNRGQWKDNPLHNWASHGADAMRTWAEGFPFSTALKAASSRRSVSRPLNWKTL